MIERRLSSFRLHPECGGELADSGRWSLAVAQPWLAGESVEVWQMQNAVEGSSGSFRILQNDSYLLGYASVDGGADSSLEKQALGLYRELLDLADQHQLARIWNWIPGINQISETGLERYQEFSRARARAFREKYGDAAALNMPAASALGVRSGILSVCFLATQHRVQHFENPLQMPAYQYPGKYGPESPSFARATTVLGVPAPLIFVSGTASIRESETLHAGDLSRQVAVTLENIQSIEAAIRESAGMNPESMERFYRVFIRNENDLRQTLELLNADKHFRNSRYMVVQADICRSDLCIEIELTLRERNAVL